MKLTAILLLALPLVAADQPKDHSTKPCPAYRVAIKRTTERGPTFFGKRVFGLKSTHTVEVCGDASREVRAMAAGSNVDYYEQGKQEKAK